MRISSPKPGIMRSPTASVASGVTSRGLGPVPPVVRMSEHLSTSASSINAASICARSSGMTRRTGRQGDARIAASAASMPGPPLSS